MRIAESELAVLDVGADDEDTVRAVTDRLQQQWATPGITQVLRPLGKTKVRARVIADVRRHPDPGDQPLQDLDAATTGFTPPVEFLRRRREREPGENAQESEEGRASFQLLPTRVLTRP
ncbi:DUF6207 family protein [Streptomyces viridiviolaceus]|uniref:DUF6207 family protein n=1 Tax=Streptomyces viridiviolaceus TaxID=68282 RepID=A0ABW2E838_9ACTN|nr:DUF6207 family protein [Streptomyces viridiviolaceus]